MITTCIIIAIVSRFIFVQQGWSTIDIFTNIDTFAYGAIPAFLLVRYKEKFENKITGIKLIYRVISVIFVIFAVTFYHYLNTSPAIDELVFAGLFCILFTILITIAVPQQNELKVGRKNVFTRMGKYTYGLYLYHPIVISLLIQVFKKFNLNTDSISYLYCFLSCHSFSSF